jgi:hypothetical protein
MDASIRGASGVLGAVPRGWRVAAVLTDLLVALVAAWSSVAMAMALAVFVAESHALLPLIAENEAAAIAVFWAFEVLVLAMVGFVAPAIVGGVTMLCLLSRRGILPGVSPGAVLLRFAHRPTGA